MPFCLPKTAFSENATSNSQDIYPGGIILREANFGDMRQIAALEVFPRFRAAARSWTLQRHLEASDL